MKKAIIAAIAGLLATPAMAIVTYECTFDGLNRNQGFISQTVVVAHEPGSDTAKVNDGVIMSVVGKPINGKVTADNDKRLSVNWKVDLKTTMNEHIRATYRLTILRSDLAANISVQPGAYDNNFAAQGLCRKING